MNEILAAVFLLMSAVPLGASFITDRVAVGNRYTKKTLEEVQMLRQAIMRIDAERHVGDRDREASALEKVR